MPCFYHYTDEEGSEKIISSGKVIASLSLVGSEDSAFGGAYGNGVYLTKLSPQTSTKSEIASNNWMNTGAQFINKTKNYFVFNIPESDVVDTNAKGRNVFLVGQRNDLQLEKYPWWLNKDFDSGQIIASYKYQVTSLGPASELHGSLMGDYVMTENWVNERPVYKRVERELYQRYYLFMSGKGNWLVGDDFGNDGVWLIQSSNFSLGPAQNVPWEYYNHAAKGKWCKDDAALKVFGWQK